MYVCLFFFSANKHFCTETFLSIWFDSSPIEVSNDSILLIKSQQKQEQIRTGSRENFFLHRQDILYDYILDIILKIKVLRFEPRAHIDIYS